MTRILVAYATRSGSTRQVAEVVAETLRAPDREPELLEAAQVRALQGYDAVILGAPLYMYRWHKDALRFLDRFKGALARRPYALFALGPTHEPHDEAEWQASWEQLHKALANYDWLNPVSIELFGGKFDPEDLGRILKMLAGSEPATDIRDWDAIRAWAAQVGGQLDAGSV